MSTREYSKFSLQLNTDYYYGSVLRSIPEPDTFMYNPLADLAPHMVPTYSLPVPSIVRAWYVLVQSVAASPTRLALPLPSASRRRCALRVCPLLRNYLVGRQRILYPGPIILTSADLYSSLYLCQISPAVATQL